MAPMWLADLDSVTVPGTAAIAVPLMLTTLDKAYIGVPMGMTVLEAGRLPTQGLESTAFFEHDITRDGLTYKIMPSDMATISLGYYIPYEAAVNGDLVNDNDISQYALWVDSKFAGGWGTRLGVMYQDNQVTDS